MDLDEIPNAILKKGGPRLVTAMLEIFNMMREAGWTLRNSIEEMVTLIFKKGNAKDLDNYTAIAISNKLGELFIWIVTN